MLRDYVRENFPADMIAPDFDEQIEVLAAELDKPADHVRAGR